MKALAINGSPRKRWNTARILESALEGARSAGAQTSMVHLYDLEPYTGCISCFACKKIGGKSYGRCAVKDGLRPVLEQALAADVLLLGSPIYFMAESGQMRAFMERLLFAQYTYTPERGSLYQGAARTALVHTMNIREEDMPAFGLDKHLGNTRMFMEVIFGNCESLLVTDTMQFDDYSKYHCPRFDPEAKAVRHETIFPQDLEKARALGERLARETSGS